MTTNNSGFLSIVGENAKKFLQGQLTCNLDEVTAAESRLGAHCNPQGRVISLFRLFLQDGNYYMQMPRELIPVAMQALQKYAVFFKVTLTDVSNSFTSDRTDILLRDSSSISQGIPAIYPETSEKFLPHELNLPELNAISFNKGCYTGQEIIARMHYRGKLKTHLYKATVETKSPITRGADIYLEGKRSGSIVDFSEIAAGHYELLVIAQDSDVKNQTLTVDPEEKYRLHFF